MQRDGGNKHGMKKYNFPLNLCGLLILGKQGENEVTSITIDLQTFADQYGIGRVEAIHENANGYIYPVDISQEGNNITWIVTDGDTSVSGYGRVEIRWYVDENLAKSKFIDTYVSPSIDAPQDPPEPAQNWVDKVLKAAEEVKDAYANIPKYEGDYTVTPKTTQQEMETEGLAMKDNVTIKPIPYYETSNGYGSTVYIGE